MKSYILILALTAVVFSSCSTAYRAGQTPDDVYFSPTHPQDEYVTAERNDDRSYQGGEDYYTDRYIRMRTLDRYQWSALDDYYFSNPYAYNYYSYGGNWNSPWNSYWAWNSFYNPYGGIPYYPGNIIIIKNPTPYSIPSKALVFNPSSYIRTSPVSPQVGTHRASGRNMNSAYYNSYNGTNSNSRYNNTNSGRRSNSNNSNAGRSSNSNSNSYRPSNSTPTRTYTPSSNTSSGSSNTGSRPSSSSSRPPR